MISRQRLANLTSATLFLCCVVWVASGIGSDHVSDSEEDEAGSAERNSDDAGDYAAHTSARHYMPDEEHHTAARLPPANGTIHMTIVRGDLILKSASSDVAFREWRYAPSVCPGRCRFHTGPHFPHEWTPGKNCCLLLVDKLKLRNLHASHALRWSWDCNT